MREQSRRARWFAGTAATLGAAAALAGILTYVGLTPWDEPSDAERVAACNAEHELLPATADPDRDPRLLDLRAEAQRGTTVWPQCTWPPAPGAAEDGYVEVRSDFAIDPDAEGNASPDFAARVLSAPCPELSVKHRLVQQGAYEFFTVQAELGQVIDHNGDAAGLPFWVEQGHVLNFDSDWDLLMVLPANFGLWDVQCVGA